METIQIAIMGTAGSGKTTISQEIVDALRNMGFAVKWDVKPEFNSEGDARRTGMERMKCIEAVSDKTTIVVKSVNVKKDINASLNYRTSKYDNRD